MERKRFFPIQLPKILISIFILSIILLICACARHKVPAEKPTRIPEKRIERKGVYHLVERHQTLYRICKTYGVDLNEVASINGIADKSRIQEGQRLFIPGADRVLKVEIYIDDVVKEPAEKEKEKEKEKEAFARVDFVWPVEGKCISYFEEEERKRHQGVDISSPSGTPIKAAGSGRVIYSGNSIRGYGNLIIIRHSEEFVTVYAHNQVNLVEEGMRVERGKIIAKVGQTGRASGPHLHFEIRQNNKALDPLLFLE
jgi:murein DD-endopeptidase MepM/ murein hydrolase activator NlpD